MAKRKRLIPTPFAPEYGSGHATDSEVAPDAAAPETKAFLRSGLGPSLGPGLGGQPSAPPIARVAGESAAQAALEEVAGAMTRARAEGRLVQALPLEAVDENHLVRDRIGLDEEELEPLIASIRANGQRMPVEVTELSPGRYGLISGWRRLQVLRRLWRETGEDRFAHVQALLRRPAEASDAYVAMIEENEIRQGLSYYERARIAARAADLGVFDSEKQALQRLFAAASRARRSKIGSFLSIYRRLDDSLRFPAAIPERLGLALAKALEERAEGAARLTADLTARPAADAAEEATRLAAFVAEAAAPAPSSSGGSGTANATPDPVPDPASATQLSPVQPSADRPSADRPPADRTEISPGIFLEVTGGFTRPVLTLSGPAVDPMFRDRLEHWLKTGH